MARGEKADSTLRSSRAVPHPSTDRALRRLTSEVGRDPVHSTRYGRWRQFSYSVWSYFHPLVCVRRRSSLGGVARNQFCQLRGHFKKIWEEHGCSDDLHPPAKLNLPCAGPRPRTPAQCWLQKVRVTRVEIFFVALAQLLAFSAFRGAGVPPSREQGRLVLQGSGVLSPADLNLQSPVWRPGGNRL